MLWGGRLILPYTHLSREPPFGVPTLNLIAVPSPNRYAGADADSTGAGPPESVAQVPGAAKDGGGGEAGSSEYSEEDEDEEEEEEERGDDDEEEATAR